MYAYQINVNLIDQEYLEKLKVPTPWARIFQQEVKQAVHTIHV